MDIDLKTIMELIGFFSLFLVGLLSYIWKLHIKQHEEIQKRLDELYNKLDEIYKRHLTCKFKGD